MKKILFGMALLIAGANIPLLPADEDRAVAWAEHHRAYLEQREIYMHEQKDIQNIPLEAVLKSTYARDNFEEKLLETKFITTKGGEIKAPKQSVVDKIITMDFVQTAYAYTFGKEDFESCGAIPCSFTGNGSYDGGAMNLDATSKINGTDTVRCDISAVGDCSLYKDVTSDNEYYFQFYILLPTGFTFGANGYMTLFTTGDGVGTPVYCSLEDYGTVRITCSGQELSYTDTGINISLNSPTRLEFKMRISTTTGDLDIWKDNTTEGSPTYNGSGTLNTGPDNITLVSIAGYHPDVVADTYYDDVILDTAFIGTGAAVSTPRSNVLWFE